LTSDGNSSRRGAGSSLPEQIGVREIGISEGDRKVDHFRRSPSVESAPLDAEEIILDGARNKFLLLNETSRFIWSRLSEPRTAEDLSDELCTAFDGVSSEDALRDVEAVLQQLLSLNLVELAGNVRRVEGETT
jgi:hypothetical protein